MWNFPIAQTGGVFWLPPPDSTTAPLVDYVFNFLFGVSIFFFALIVFLMTLFVIRYRRRPGRESPEKAPSHSTALEIFWSVIPLCIVVYVFVVGYRGYIEMREPPPNCYEIRVTAQKWKWFFTYPNGYVDENLHVPVDRPIRLVMTSRDVIHSLFIPAFRVKMDAVPGRYTSTWFQSVKPSEYDLLCAEYCGDGHSAMLAKVIVHKPGEFEKWLEESANVLKNKSPVEAGEYYYNRMGCVQCHSIDGSRKVGPSFLGIWGETVQFTDGTSAVVDENYVRESILDPSAKVVAGYPDQMSAYKGIITEDQIYVIIEYIKSLKHE
ncbi:cytochrome c oxidase subunit II [Thermostilla marina]